MMKDMRLGVILVAAKVVSMAAKLAVRSVDLSDRWMAAQTVFHLAAASA